jgi:hypothetical protein
MSKKKTNSIPHSYRITAEDVDRGWKMLASYFLNHEPWTDELELAQILTDGGDMQRASGKWPTVDEVLAHRERQQAEAEQRRKR